MDIAASVQKVTEEIILRMTRELSSTYGIDNLCLAGGVALNCVANGKVLRDGDFKRVFIQPAAGDAGGSVGAALAAYHQHFGQPRKFNGALDAMHGSYLGPEFGQDEIEKRLDRAGRGVHHRRQRGGTLPAHMRRPRSWPCRRLVPGSHGVRAARPRSPLDPRRPAQPDMQKRLNLKIKYRESFRPFAPSVLREDVADYFELDADSPYMLLVADVKRNRRTQHDDRRGGPLRHR